MRRKDSISDINDVPFFNFNFRQLFDRCWEEYDYLEKEGGSGELEEEIEGKKRKEKEINGSEREKEVPE